jgi:RNA polymerase sigma-70 factor (ECF subfamily)
METRGTEPRRGLTALRLAIRCALATAPAAVSASPVLSASSEVSPGPGIVGPVGRSGWLASEAMPLSGEANRPGRGGKHRRDVAADDPDEETRLAGLVELARGGDAEAFGQLYDHYNASVYRFLYYRLGAAHVAEDLMAETFLRALRGIASFKWQGRDFGAWLMTIARNLAHDHYKAARTRHELVTEDMSAHDSATEGPENAVLDALTNQALLTALRSLPEEQQDCLVMRFLQGLSIAETARVLGRSDGAVKQLQLRAVRNLAKRMPEGLR